MWMIRCFPRGNRSSDNDEHLSVFVQLENQPRPRSVSAIVEVFLMGKDGQPSSTAQRMTGVHLFQMDDWGWSRFVTRDDLVENHVKDGHIRIMCGIMVVNDLSIPVPPSNIAEHLGTLLDSADGADVSFIVGNETFHAHRALLAARSPVFKAELLGSKAEAKTASITLHGIAPATFKLMLQFMYTDTFPGDELGECPSEMIRHLLAVAVRYALDRLKLSCAQKLWDVVSVDTVAATLACAEMYNCLELKIKCIEFFAMEKNFRKAVLTDGFVQLVQQFPSIVAELRERSVAVYSAGMQGHPIDFRFHEFRLDYEQTKHLAVGKAVYSDPFSAGGHMWKIKCFPRGSLGSDNDKHLSVFIQLDNQPRARSVSAIIQVFLMDKDGQPSSTAQTNTGFHLFQKDGGWSRFVTQTDLVENHVKDGHIKIICGIMVNDRCIPVPPSDIAEHLGTLLDSTDAVDVSFIVSNETFHAHRVLLAARSPVFRAELLRSMAEATMASITLHDIAPATFKLMLRFMYTDTFPGDAELGECPSEMIHHLLAAADRYALDRLKLSCAQKLWDIVSVDTVAATLACAEMYNCPELKIKCIEFFAMEKNFRKAVLTDGFVQLVQQFPSIIAELREGPVA